MIMWNMNDVTRIDYVGSYVYHITFDNGVSGEVDFSEYINRGPIFMPNNSLPFIKNANAGNFDKCPSESHISIRRNA